MKNKFLPFFFLNFILIFLFIFGFIYLPSILAGQEQSQKKQKEEKSIRQKLIEEVEVSAPSPEIVAAATTSIVKHKIITKIHPRNLDEVIKLMPGIYVSEGGKGEASLKIRGLGAKRITLLLDSIPVYEPYFNSFDLKMFSLEEIETIKVVKGTSSVLYGPNTLGGVVNIITRRPNYPFFTFRTQIGENKSSLLSLSEGGRLRRFSFFGSFSQDVSAGYNWIRDGQKLKRENSDYRKTAFTGKIYNDGSELMASLNIFEATFGLPPAIEVYRARFWRFKDWKRLQMTLGGMWSLNQDWLITLRGYYISHRNVLNAYPNNSYQELIWASTYRNHTSGMFCLGENKISEHHKLSWSLNLKNDVVNTQDDYGEPWENYQHLTFSCGVEDKVRFSSYFSLVLGIGLDYLKKQDGQVSKALNPLVALNFFP